MLTRAPWDVDVSMSVGALARLARALIATDSQLTDSTTVGGTASGRGARGLLRVQVPVGSEDAFRATCQPLRMTEPPVIDDAPSKGQED